MADGHFAGEKIKARGRKSCPGCPRPRQSWCAEPRPGSLAPISIHTFRPRCSHFACPLSGFLSRSLISPFLLFSCYCFSPPLPRQWFSSVSDPHAPQGTLGNVLSYGEGVLVGRVEAKDAVNILRYLGQPPVGRNYPAPNVKRQTLPS